MIPIIYRGKIFKNYSYYVSRDKERLIIIFKKDKVNYPILFPVSFVFVLRSKFGNKIFDNERNVGEKELLVSRVSQGGQDVAKRSEK